MKSLNEHMTVAALRYAGYAVQAVHAELEGIDMKKVEDAMFKYACLALDEQYMAMARRAGWTVPYPGDPKAAGKVAAHYGSSKYAASWLEAATIGAPPPEEAEPTVCQLCDETIDMRKLVGLGNDCCPRCNSPIHQREFGRLRIGTMFVANDGATIRRWVKVQEDAETGDNAVFVGDNNDAEYWPGTKVPFSHDAIVYPFNEGV